MEKGVLIILLVCILSIQVVFAETTFFEGDYDYRDDFIMANLPGDIVNAITDEEIEILQVSGGGYFLREYYEEEICDVCTESLKEHINEYQDIDYNEDEVIVLTELINQEFQTDLSNNQVRYIIENFEDECDAPYPLLGGIAGGRLRNLTNPLTLTITSIVLIFFIIIGYLIIRVLRKRGYGRKKKKQR